MVVHLVIGTRPQYVKWAALDATLRKRCTLTVIDTGQHYDDALTTALLRDFRLPPPDVNLGVGSKSANAQIASIMTRLESFWRSHRPDFVIVVGDTNSTLAGALAAAKCSLPVGHVEAGIRSFSRSMPEEVNRVVTDHLSTLLWCPTTTAVVNLRREGIHRHVVWTGDVTYEMLLRNRPRLTLSAKRSFRLKRKQYAVLTLHRASNTGNPKHMVNILSGLRSYPLPIVFPIHPRTNVTMKKGNISIPHQIVMSEPLGYLAFLGLIKDADMVITDSGGVMREAAWLGVPVVVTRDETEWPELVRTGWNTLVGADATRIAHAVAGRWETKRIGRVFGDVHVSARIVQSLSRWFQDEQENKHAF